MSHSNTNNKPTKVMSLYNRVSRLPFGNKIFSIMVSRMAPYFSTVKPIISELNVNRCVCQIKKRKAVHNHIQTVHVIAICNGLEMAMGVMAEASIPHHLRWIPKGMSVDYTAKAGSDITCVAEVKPEQWVAGDMLVPVTAYDTDGVVVVQGTIKLWISEKPSKH
ncbi:hotdog fold domain-containing protein [Shewanella fidelis]|uniref:Hotdog fold domain-containing protein n=1 Tax=Shewanella fidelis TaxID=173509 RepID=A0AAW8NNW7_9GAMM|nr:hotdog fold domain-containing protein [Shewanella fidelis]MDR8524893.1 hotdog fold domain-containing protein [Shewanella fidelis]MDW4810964.1 hotdog fold domain-containing protein [Shewanella fidelis]MDW4815257.1 hotdog fold domain-containing protein [Shewanella fidelis]MDW4819347.1 hotdog fold domain-containing protein [Shewanella fidelis]MDW4822975.1 hotdog fold domain-containing protein [Shewanella fidelis]